MKSKWMVGTYAVGAWLLTLPLVPAQANVVLPTPAVQSVLPEAFSVSGHAEIKAKPDVAYFNISVVTQAATTAQLDSATRDNATRTAAVLNALRKAGLANTDFQTQSYTVDPQYDYKPSPPVLTGFQVTNTVRITAHDLTKVGTLIDTALKAGANQFDALSFDLLDRKGAERQALANAVRDARARAETLAEASSTHVGRLLSLTDGGTSSVVPVYAPRLMSARAAEATTPITPQQITITADANATYAITP